MRNRPCDKNHLLLIRYRKERSAMPMRGIAFCQALPYTAGGQGLLAAPVNIGFL
jgi:hypothetical protein